MFDSNISGEQKFIWSLEQLLYSIGLVGKIDERRCPLLVRIIYSMFDSVV